MSIRYEFYCELDGNELRLPDEIASRFRLKGIRRLHVVASAAEEEESELEQRGISSDTIDRIAATQRYDRDVALAMLGGEGGAHGAALAERLARLTSDTERPL